MSKPMAEVERDVLATYFENHWKRSELSSFPAAPEIPDPGHGHDELSPVVYFGLPFDAGKPQDLDALSSFAVQELRGHPLWVLDILDGPFAGEEAEMTSIDGINYILEPLAGPIAVVPQTPVEDGATVFFTSSSGDFNAVVAAGWIHGAGITVLNVVDLGPGGLNGRGHYDTGKSGPREQRIGFQTIFGIPPSNSPLLAEQLGSAAFAILQGVDFIRDETAAIGTHERDMADSKIASIRQLSMDPASPRTNFIADSRGWRWFEQQTVFRRLFTIQRVGKRTVAA